MKGKRLSEAEREKKEKDLEIALEERSKRLEFAEDFLERHTYLSTKRMTTIYEGLRKNDGQPSRSNVWHFGAILKGFRERGLIEKYNNSQYKKI